MPGHLMPVLAVPIADYPDSLAGLNTVLVHFLAALDGRNLVPQAGLVLQLARSAIPHFGVKLRSSFASLLDLRDEVIVIVAPV